MPEFNLAAVVETVADAVPERPCIVWRGRSWSYGEVVERSRRLAGALVAAGVRTDASRRGLAPYESGQDHVGLYLHNGPEYLEGMLGSFMARAVPCNVNYRYVAEELRALLGDAAVTVVVVHSAFTPTLAEVRADLPHLRTVLQVDDGSGLPLLDGARWYEEALAEAPTELDPDIRERWSPDDLYALFTGGTTGLPKGVLWRQADIWVAAMGGRKLGTVDEWSSLDELAEAARAGGGARLLPTAPFMHGAAHWMAFNALGAGNTVVLPDTVEHLDPDDVLDVVEREHVNVVLVVGDALARPLVERIEAGGRDLSDLLMVVSGGATLSSPLKERLMSALPSLMVLDGLGASETGQQATLLSAPGQVLPPGAFQPGPGMLVLDEGRGRVLTPGEAGVGWLAQSGRVPLGYLGHPDKTAETFPVVDGIRLAVPGDRVRWRDDGLLQLLGRDAATINTGGEKVFAEEVEQAILAHPDVVDVIVCGRPSERWGSEVVAVVALRPGATVEDAALAAEAGRHVARYKLPKAWCRVDAVERSPAGKADRRWAVAVAASIGDASTTAASGG